jgi:hypothetical protein
VTSTAGPSVNASFENKRWISNNAATETWRNTEGAVRERWLGRFRRDILRNVYHNFPPCDNIFDMIHDGPHHSKKEIIPPGGGEQSFTARETLASPSIIFYFWEIKVALACRPKRLLKSYLKPSCRLSSPPHHLSEGLAIAIAVVFAVPTVAAVVVAAVALATVVAVVVTVDIRERE